MYIKFSSIFDDVKFTMTIKFISLCSPWSNTHVCY